MLKLVVGLGNPGRRYAGTRHNVGFDVLDLVARRHGVRWAPWRALAEVGEWRRLEGRVLLVKPLTFMNLSGEAVAALAAFYKVDLAEVLVVCDDVNLPVGRLRARPGGSDGGNNGLKSVAASLGTDDYARLRIGVGRGETGRDLADHVLSRFTPEEQSGIDEAVPRAADAIEMWIDDGTARVMNAFN